MNRVPGNHTRSLLAICALCCLLASVSAADLALPNAKLTIPAPAGWSLLAVDLGKPFGNTDLIMDATQEHYITFMIIPPESGDDPADFMRGMINGLTKQKAVIKQSQTIIAKIARPTVAAEVPTPEGSDRRVYVQFSELNLLVLVQHPIPDAHQLPEVMAVLENIRRTPSPIP